MIRSFIPITIGSAAGFQCFNTALDHDFLPFPPPPGKYAGADRHKWRNATTSLVNSAIIAAIVLYSFLRHPELWRSPELFYCVSAEVCSAVISGYLIYDTFDLAVHNSFSKVWTLLIHHVIMGFIFFAMSIEETAMGIVLIGLLCEFSAIFLHSRLLLLMYGFSKRSPLYSVHKVFNLLTFVLLRMAPMVYSCYAAITASGHLPAYLAVSMPLLIASIMVINSILLWRLLRSDFLQVSAMNNHIMDN